MPLRDFLFLNDKATATVNAILLNTLLELLNLQLLQISRVLQVLQLGHQVRIFTHQLRLGVEQLIGLVVADVKVSLQILVSFLKLLILLLQSLVVLLQRSNLLKLLLERFFVIVGSLLGF